MEHIKNESFSDEENHFLEDFGSSDLKNEDNPEPIVKLEKSDVHLTLKKMQMKAELTLRKLNSNAKANLQTILRVRSKKPKGKVNLYSVAVSRTAPTLADVHCIVIHYTLKAIIEKTYKSTYVNKYK
ncbi:hypothetical protein EVAR_23357_1 [Eumeta japonica]|uniref:Uncharacterized protein n=1 Tax=Eumeta variegata TaxID=151549 RepID=A0A4C1VWX4_EUMVA|nr:hypothetical protein EVAR_23357_1 [Eumeta japonica]